MDMLTFIYPLRKQWTLSQVSTDAQNHFLGLEDEGGKQKGIWQDLKWQDLCPCRLGHKYIQQRMLGLENKS